MTTSENSYKCLKKQEHSLENYKLIPIRQSDMGLIKKWRNSQIDILRQSAPLTDKAQKKYYQEVLAPSFSEKHPHQILFSYFYGDTLIGYGGLVHIAWNSKRAEVSFLLDTDRANDEAQYKKDHSVFLQLIKEVSFNHLHFHRLFTETFDIRPIHIETIESQGFILEGKLREHVLIKDKYIDSLIHGCLNTNK